MTHEMRKEPDQEAKGKLTLRQMLKELFGLGCIGFGGGSALIPVFRERLVDTEKIDEEEFEGAVAVACITPGALPVELASGIGLKTHGALGALAAAAAFALPGVAATIIVLLALTQSGDAALDQVAILAVGVSGYILSVIARYIVSNARRAKTSKGRAASIALIVAVFALTCGKSLAKLLGIQGVTPLIVLGTVDVMALAFFAAIWIGSRQTPARIATGVFAIAAYCTLRSSIAILDPLPDWLSSVLAGAMILMAVFALIKDRKANCTARAVENAGKTIRTLLAFALVILAALIVAVFASSSGAVYIENGALSSILSFGGGDAYIAMADGMFVGTDIVSQDDFYSIVVPVSNALPGSILCKVLVGCGFTAGLDSEGATTAALVMSLAGFATAIAMSCATFAAGNHLFASLKGLVSFRIIEKTIGCVVSGLLLTVALGLLQVSVNAAGQSMPPALAIGLPVLIAAGNLYAKQRLNLPAPAAVILSALASAIVLNLA